MSSNNYSNHPSSSINLEPLASQPDRLSSLVPQHTPPSTDHLFSSSAFQLSSSQIDSIPSRRARGRNELGDRSRYLEGVEEMLSETDVAPASSAGEPIKVIWGTNIVISESIAALKSFLSNFSLAQRHLYEHQLDNSTTPTPLLDDSIMAADLEPYYPKILKKVPFFPLIYVDSRY